ncbi:hypothetical protein EZV62_014694 [Acer yangbiense]|uniref:Uncharacterized protein n=1 Tax=Acer yangbiense TaxID=1000413 RepID=A0A5C7HSV8_9ROSI|nr:hypothetical protein EZV62_014694 [Acer yangbiense]
MANAYLSGAENPSPDIYIQQQWSKAADSIAYDSNTSPPPIALICGAKNCGKTTFSRHLVNILLQRFVDVWDVVTYDLIFIFCRSFYFGDVSSKRDPTADLKYIFTLYDYYRKEYCMLNNSESPGRIELPLVVNTPGWPTNVVKINVSFEKKNLPAGAFWLDGICNGDVSLIEINSARQDAFNRS